MLEKILYTGKNKQHTEIAVTCFLVSHNVLSSSLAQRLLTQIQSSHTFMTKITKTLIYFGMNFTFTF